MRRVIAALVVLGLAVGVFLLWPRSDEAPSADTQAVATTSTTSTTAPASSTTSMAPTTSSSGGEGRIVETVEEAEAILRELWFGWFEGIYNRDEDRIREVVGTHQMLDAAVAAFGQLPFTSMPTAEAMTFRELEILRATETCLAVWSVTEPSYLDVSEPRSGVEVLRAFDGSWRLVAAWRFREDLWEADCESHLLPLS